MTKWELFKLLHRHVKLAEKRSPIMDQNTAGKVFIYLGAIVMGLYFAAFGTMWGYASDGEAGFIMLLMPFWLMVDFFSGMATRQIPAMLVRPYSILPIKRDDVISHFLLSQTFSSNTAFWLFFVLPFAFITWCGGATTCEALLCIVCSMTLFLLNSQWFMIVIALTKRTILWWLLPTVVYGSFIGGMVLLAFCQEKLLDDMLEFVVDWSATLLALAVYIICFALLYMLNLRVQRTIVIEEESKKESVTTEKTKSWKLSWLDGWGGSGEYLKLEIKSTLRNKAIRERFLAGIVIITLLSVMLAFSDIYDSWFSINMWCLYCFLYFGAVNLVKIMGPEGNYIDVLMVHRENILQLLTAKYYFYCAVILLPLLILIPPVVTGRFTILMLAAYFTTVAGPTYCALFSLAIFNCQTLPLNNTAVGKANFENKIQFVMEILAFFAPVIILVILRAFVGDTVAYTILTVVGVSFIASHKLWLRIIYNKMQKRRYTLLEGFHASR